MKQLEEMRAEYSVLLKKRREATLSYTDWCKLGSAAKAAHGGKTFVKVPIYMRIGTVVKIAGVITVSYNVGTGGIVYAAEEGARDLAFADEIEGALRAGADVGDNMLFNGRGAIGAGDAVSRSRFGRYGLNEDGIGFAPPSSRRFACGCGTLLHPGTMLTDQITITGTCT